MESNDSRKLETTAAAPTLRNRDVAPPAYLVLNSINDGEGDKPFCCPHLGCDGFSFDTVQECHEHEDDWHCPPYRCSECESSFAALPGLTRHLKASGHVNWICEQRGCEMEGIKFGSPSSFMAHALGSSSHQTLDHWKTYRSGTRPNYAESDLTFDDELSDCPSEEEFLCLEPCCSRYQRPMFSKREYERHVNSYGHVSAVKLSEILRQSDLSEAELEAKQDAARAFRCESEGCHSYGRKLTTSQAYYRHLETTQHRDPSGGQTSPTPAAKRKTTIRVKIVCTEEECPKYLHRFLGMTNYTKHTNSAAHIKASRYSEMMRRVGSAATGGQGDQEMLNGYHYHETGQPTPFSSSFSTMSPATDTTRSCFSMITPTKRPISDMPGSILMSPPSWREELLQSQNKELEGQVRQLRDELSEFKISHEKEIDIILGMLNKQG